MKNKFIFRRVAFEEEENNNRCTVHINRWWAYNCTLGIFLCHYNTVRTGTNRNLVPSRLFILLFFYYNIYFFLKEEEEKKKKDRREDRNNNNTTRKKNNRINNNNNNNKEKKKAAAPRDWYCEKKKPSYFET